MHFRAVFHFYTPENIRKHFGFLIFLWGKAMQQDFNIDYGL